MDRSSPERVTLEEFLKRAGIVDVSEWATEYRVVGTQEGCEAPWHGSKTGSFEEAANLLQVWNLAHPEDTNVIQSRKVGPWE